MTKYFSFKKAFFFTLIIGIMVLSTVSGALAANYDYWRENDSKLWVKLNLSAGTPQTLYLGTAGAYASSGVDTFLAFDDFENNSVASWTGTSTKSVASSGLCADCGNYALSFLGADYTTTLYTKESLPDSIAMDYDFKTDSNLDIYSSTHDGGSTVDEVYVQTVSYGFWRARDGAWVTTAVPMTLSQWENVSLQYDNTTTVRVESNGYNYNYTAPSLTDLDGLAMRGRYSGNSVLVDNFRVRNLNTAANISINCTGTTCTVQSDTPLDGYQIPIYTNITTAVQVSDSFVSSNSTYMVTVNDLYNDTTVPSANVSFFNGGSRVWTELTDANGEVTFSSAAGYADLNVTVAKTGFMQNDTFNVLGNGSINAGLFAGMYDVTSVTEKITGSTLGAALGVWEVEHDDGGKTYEECVGTYPCDIYLTNGINNLTLTYSGVADYYDKAFIVNISAPENATGTVSGVYDNLFTVNAENVTGGAITTSTSITANNTALGFTENCVTTNGTCVFGLIQSYNYTFDVQPTNYEYKNTTATASSDTNTVTTKHYFKNSISIRFSDQETGDLINTTVYLEMISDAQSANYTTANGTLETEVLSPDSYTLRYNAAGYLDSFYSFTIVDNYHYFLNLTLLNVSSGSNVTIYVYDTLGNRVESAEVSVLKYDVVDNDFDITEILSTNFEGRAMANIILNNEYYKFMVAYEGNNVLTTAPTYIYGTELTLYINIQESGLEDYFTQSTLYGNITCSNSTHVCTYNYNDMDSVATQGCVYAYRLSVSGETLYDSSCSSGAAGTAYVTLLNTSGSTYVVKGYITKAGSDHYVTEYMMTYDTPAPEGGLGLFLLIIVGLVMIGIAFWSMPIAVALFGIVTFLFSLIGFIQIPIGYTLPIAILSIILSFMLGRKR